MKLTLRVLYYATLGGIGLIGLMFASTLIPVPGNLEVKVFKSGSMEPAVHVGSIVVVKPAATYAAGDVITFGEDTKTQIPTTHRIVRVEGSGAQTLFVTKGDANDAEDPTPTSISKVKGKMLFTVPYVGYALAFARTKLGFFLLVGVPAAVIVVEELLNIFKEMRRIRRKKAADTVPETRVPIKSRKVMGVFAILGLLGISSAGGLHGSTIAFYANSAVSKGNLLQAGEFNLPSVARFVMGEVEVLTSSVVVSEPEPVVEETSPPQEKETPAEGPVATPPADIQEEPLEIPEVEVTTVVVEAPSL